LFKAVLTAIAMKRIPGIRASIAGFFPVQLLGLHLQRNFILLFFWLLLFGFVSGFIGKSYGIHYLFLYPEYLGDVSIWSFGLLGFAYGGFVMAFNITAYIFHARRFPFLATLSAPFLKFCLNNSILPIVFYLFYTIRTFVFLLYNEFEDPLKSFIWLGAFTVGMLLFILASLGYFFGVNKDMARLFGVDAASRARRQEIRLALLRLKKSGTSPWLEDSPVKYYLRRPFKIAVARSALHYDPGALWKVFRQNHVSGSIFQLGIMLSLFGLGLFREIPVFRVPAGAAFMLLFTLWLMLAGTVHFLLKRWAFPFFIIFLLSVHWISTWERFSVTNYAYGLSYSNPTPYHPDSLVLDYIKRDAFRQDLKFHESMLQRWRKKVRRGGSSKKKPLAIFITCSGGGSKAAYWSFISLQHADSMLGGKLLEHTVLITGASGGMVGASYLRELMLREKQGEIPSIYDSIYAEQIGADLLNGIATTIALNDAFLRVQRFHEGENRYTKDRGYAFELQLNENTDQAFSRRLGDYKEPEMRAIIPLMVFNPTILNDGKRLLVSPLPISFLTNNFPGRNTGYRPITEDIEFSHLFRENGADQVRFSSVVRMNATFPYILPTVSLPSSPSLEIADAGMRDNYGVRTALRYLYHLRNWFERNTRGILLIRVHDSRSYAYDQPYTPGILKQWFTPLSGIVNNLNSVHQQENDQWLQFAGSWYKGPIEVVDFRLSEVLPDEISLSWHLTSREKAKIKAGLRHVRMEKAIERIRELMR
jgi:hypothetical protein